MADDRTLELLGQVLGAGPDREPPPDRLASLRDSVEARRVERSSADAGGPETEEPGGDVVPLRRQRWRRRLAVAAAVIVAALAGAVIGHVMPGPVRDFAHDLFPGAVESTELHEAREALHELGLALAAEDAEAACEADTRMLDLVALLDEAEKDEIVPVAHEVHERAVAFVGGPCE